MKILIKSISLLFPFMILGACSLNENAADLYHQESPLQAEVSMPEDFSGSEPIKIYLEQDGHPVEEADFAHVEIWKGDGKIHDEMKEARNVGQGNYTFSRKLSDDGLYYIKVHAGNNGSIIMPTLPFAVGELSKADIEALNAQTTVESDTHSGHH
ncbi:FixH family protein [Bacillus sp. KH172YL63]|uniref:FixH family protein n=1 Tax=Bacillus sp. KH172YL63 TaxID=2709784 RepID=UPI0013E5190D|nr:FixH family protein [Bacillus sp. KH172YL63]BCB04237.1 hypothetical protein KH172YL63_23700 [Bacillus sp. KH172YL63]